MLNLRLNKELIDRQIILKGIILRPLHFPQFIHPVAYALDFALPGKFVPDCLRILIGRGDGHDSGLAAGAHRADADPRLVVELGKFQALLEGLKGRLEFLRAGALRL